MNLSKALITLFWILVEYQLENSTYQQVLADTTQMYEEKIAELIKQLGDERARSETAEEQLDAIKILLSDSEQKIQVRNVTISKISQQKIQV